MQLILTGINHKSASVDIRQPFAFDSNLVCRALTGLKQVWPNCEFVLLSTCNRMECYAAVDKTAGPSPAALAEWFSDYRGVDYDAVRQAFYFKTDDDVAAHLFTVASSLDSMVIGETQIAFQVKESYKLACRCQTTGKVLNHLFHEAFRTTKKIVNGTSIFNRRVSVAGVAVDLAKRLLGNVQAASVVIAGAGEMAALLVEHFRHENCAKLTIVNRSDERACQLAQKHDVLRKPWERLDDEVAAADILIGAASTAEKYLFDEDRVRAATAWRQDRPLLIIDIAVPRCFDPAVNRLDNVHLYNIDDLAQVAEDNIKLRQGDLETAVEIICESVSAFMDWFLVRDVTPLVGRLKEAFEQVYEIQRQQLYTQSPSLTSESTDLLKGRVINKLCRRVIHNINTLSKEHGPQEAEHFARNLLKETEQLISGSQSREKHSS